MGLLRVLFAVRPATVECIVQQRPEPLHTYDFVPFPSKSPRNRACTLLKSLSFLHLGMLACVGGPGAAMEPGLGKRTEEIANETVPPDYKKAALQ